MCCGPHCLGGGVLCRLLRENLLASQVPVLEVAHPEGFLAVVVSKHRLRGKEEVGKGKERGGEGRGGEGGEGRGSVEGQERSCRLGEREDRQ